VLPAVDVGKSVSRVGGKAQLPAYRSVAGALKLSYAQFEELEAFARFATRLDDRTRATIERGRRVREALQQHEHAPMSPAEQVAVLHAAGSGLFDGLEVPAVARLETAVRRAATEQCAGICDRIVAGEALADGDWKALRDAAAAAIREARDAGSRE